MFHMSCLLGAMKEHMCKYIVVGCICGYLKCATCIKKIVSLCKVGMVLGVAPHIIVNLTLHSIGVGCVGLA